ncbi:TetR/AcrR family transcriptional regulator [Nissabacter sp. SGAir0207]|uniref:TetR/AcrR family transcriptional regulator n=1 Tax=Nissabacter sp. SGAir0207 TaxID=2126321 RepID=UPI0010CD559A|nr:TetR/AcrR family transcriptional regulator [Nissabacter sp. SGAir0207]QCR38044.1 TetR/AcrR family transcriptional regulator [Nissabacter sp. SGAir0207]
MSDTLHEKPESARDRLLGAARVLFYNDGIAATGIDAITKRAGVAKKSLYNNFASKAELIATYLQIRHEEWLALYALRLQQATTPQERVLAVFLAYEDHAEYAYERGFRGCGLLNAAAELPAGAPGRQAVRIHKEEVEAILAGHLAEMLAGDRERAALLARHFAFLLEGSISRAGLEGNGECVRQAKTMALAMMEAL